MLSSNITVFSVFCTDFLQSVFLTSILNFISDTPAIDPQNVLQHDSSTVNNHLHILVIMLVLISEGLACGEGAGDRNEVFVEKFHGDMGRCTIF